MKRILAIIVLLVSASCSETTYDFENIESASALPYSESELLKIIGEAKGPFKSVLETNLIKNGSAHITFVNNGKSIRYPNEDVEQDMVVRLLENKEGDQVLIVFKRNNANQSVLTTPDAARPTS